MLWPLSILFIALGALRAWNWLNHFEVRRGLLAQIRIATTILARFFLGAFLNPTMGLPDESLDHLQRYVAIGLISSIAVYVAAAQLHDKFESESIIEALTSARRTGHDKLKQLKLESKNALTLIAPTGWHEFHPRKSLTTTRRSTNLFPRAITAILVTYILLIATLGATYIHLDKRDVTEVARTIIGFNTLGAISVLTLIGAITIIAAMILTTTNILDVEVNLSGCLNAVSTFTAYGSIAGFLTAATIPLTSQWLSTLQDSPIHVSPQLLIDLPAIGAIMGFGFGLIHMTTKIFSSAENLILQCVACPTLLVLSAAAVFTYGITPRRITTQLVNLVEPPSTPCPKSLTANPHDYEPATIMHLAERCGTPNIYLDDTSCLVTVAIITALISGVNLRGSVKSRRIAHKESQTTRTDTPTE